MSWVADNLDLIADRAWSHLLLALPAIVLAVAISLPIGWLAHRYRWSRFTLLAAAGLIYAIPSLPLFVVLPALAGWGVRDELNVIAALTLYGIALMVRTVADALDSVDPEARLAATAVGFSAPARLARVELPLAAPVLLAGVRVVAVSTISLVTVSSLLGVANLGLLFIDGFQRGINAEVTAGIVATMLLALVLDALLVATGRLLMPWNTRAAT